jgi:hypothetical protein
MKRLSKRVRCWESLALWSAARRRPATEHLLPCLDQSTPASDHAAWKSRLKTPACHDPLHFFLKILPQIPQNSSSKSRFCLINIMIRNTISLLA